ncbi:hypothetical protein D3C79_864800 [compost metagenome]
MQALHRVLHGLEAVSLVHAVPLLQNAGVIQVGIAQAVGVLLVPVQAPWPLDHRAEYRAVDVAFDRRKRAVLSLDHHRQRLAAHGL